MTSLNDAQRESLDAYKGYNVPGRWFISEDTTVYGEVEAVFIGDGFLWSLVIDRNGNVHSSEAKVSTFTTGIEV